MSPQRAASDQDGRGGLPISKAHYIRTASGLPVPKRQVDDQRSILPILDIDVRKALELPAKTQDYKSQKRREEVPSQDFAASTNSLAPNTRSKKQLDGPIEPFPSIAAVLKTPGSLSHDRAAGEDTYYEAIGEDGVTRRVSLMNSVSKDDYLLARGANPRTGLITPGFNSAAGSINE
ncbi:hypothetical protein LTR66_017453, partial [Elasticomyces elasticus]